VRDLRSRIAEALAEHEDVAAEHGHAGSVGNDMYDSCCLDVIMAAVEPDLEELKILDALYAAGVDNWDGYSEAMRLMRSGS
jgi:hypothetical protein